MYYDRFWLNEAGVFLPTQPYAPRPERAPAAPAQPRLNPRDPAAIARARGLLLERLLPEQRETFERYGWFIVSGGMSRQRYRVHAERGLVGNIDALLGGGEEVSHRLCGHVQMHHGVPHHDHILAQKLMLEAAEDEFLRLANRHAA